MPDIMLNVDFEFMVLSREKGHAARMLTPGPIISGFRIPGLAKQGPLEAKEVIAGDSGLPITVPLNKIAAVGVVVEFI